MSDFYDDEPEFESCDECGSSYPDVDLCEGCIRCIDECCTCE